jgi:HTH-type transcriptional repressor of NAD biosynthesis genes
MDRTHDRPRGWAGGGSWSNDPSIPDPPEPPPPPPPRPANASAPPVPIERFGPPERRAAAGLVCGRFLPLHRGHQLLIEAARQSVEALTVLVVARPDDPIPADLRVAWVRALFPGVTVATAEGPPPPPNAPDFASQFAAMCAGWSPRGSRAFFTSDPSGRAAAEALGATLVPVDPPRAVVPISGTQIREDVLARFDHLPGPVRPAFVRRVAIVGAESTGKSTLCAALAEKYGTARVPEHARTLAEARGGSLDPEAIQLAARGQIALEEAAAQHAHRALFCDTDVLTVQLWSERLFGGTVPAWIREEARSRAYDLVLVAAPDVPFVGARERDQPAARVAFHARLVEELTARGQAFCELRGYWDRRLELACEAIDALLARGGFLAARHAGGAASAPP